jgi:hypothetical protein
VDELKKANKMENDLRAIDADKLQRLLAKKDDNTTQRK